MAASIIVIQQPSGITSASNDAIYTVSGNTNSPAFTDYKYVANVFVNGNQAVTLKAFPDPLYGVGVFNLKNIIPSLLGYTFNDQLSEDLAVPVGAATTSSAPVYITFSQEYIDPGQPLATQFIQSSGLTTSNTTTFFNGALPYKMATSINLGNYIVDGTAGRQFLTKYDQGTKPKLAYPKMRQWLYFYATPSAAPSARIKTFDAYGNTLGSYRIANPGASTGGVYYIATGIPQLSGLTTSQYTVDSGQTPMIQANVASYQVTVANGGLDLTTPFVYNVTQDCSNRWAPFAYTIHWLNEFGAIDSFYFNRKNEITTNLTQTIIKQNYGTLQQTGMYNIRQSDRGLLQQYTMTQDQLDASTDFVRQYDMVFLKGLQQSPIIYAEWVKDGSVLAANLSGDPYVIPKRVNERLFAARFKFDLAQQNFGQPQ